MKLKKHIPDERTGISDLLYALREAVPGKGQECQWRYGIHCRHGYQESLLRPERK